MTIRRIEFKLGPLWEFLCDQTTRHLDLEGAIRSGKTTAAVWKIIHSCLTYAGIHWLAFRYSDDDTRTKLKPLISKSLGDIDVGAAWHAAERCFQFVNGSKLYCFGLKAQDQQSRYAKLRGTTLAGIYGDQAEEFDYDVYQELIGRLTQSGYPHQLLLTPNPPSEDHWLALEFPTDNRHAGNRYLRVSIYDNAQNLDAEVIRDLEQVYPVGHPKHGPMLLGIRGLGVQGRPVYGALDPREPATAAFDRARHERPLQLDARLPLYEGIDYGKAHPCVVWAQYTPWGELFFLGGIMGHHLYLEDFAPIIQQYRRRWFPAATELLSCCDPAGSHSSSHGLKATGVKLLRDLGFQVIYQPDSNSPAVRRAIIERLAGYMRRRSTRGEAFGVDSERWLRIGAATVTRHHFLADGFEAGYVWDRHQVSVGGKRMDRPLKDGWYEHGQNAAEYLEHNFGGPQPTLETMLERAAARRPRDVEDIDPYDLLVQAAQHRAGRHRGGYA